MGRVYIVCVCAHTYWDLALIALWPVSQMRLALKIILAITMDRIGLGLHP